MDRCRVADRRCQGSNGSLSELPHELASVLDLDHSNIGFVCAPGEDRGSVSMANQADRSREVVEVSLGREWVQYVFPDRITRAAVGDRDVLKQRRLARQLRSHRTLAAVNCSRCPQDRTSRASALKSVTSIWPIAAKS